MKKTFIHILLLAGLIPFYQSCSSDNTPIQPEPEPEPIILEQSNARIESSGGEVILTFKSSQEYSIQNHLDWCKVEVEEINTEEKSEFKSYTLHLLIDESYIYEDREGYIKIIVANKEYPIQVKQAARTLTIQNLGAFQYENIKADAKNIHFDIVYNSTARVHPHLQNKIFGHQLLDVEEFFIKNEITTLDYDYPTTSFTTEVGDNFNIFQNRKPSLELQKEMEKTILKNSSAQSTSFTFSNGKKYYSRKELHYAGQIAFNLKLDELMGTSYKKEELKNKVGFIFEYEHLFFSLTSDLPESKIILPESISEDNIAFISTIYYGKFGYLFVETDLDNKVEIKSILNKFANKEVLTSKENEIINASNFGYLKPGIDKYDFIKGIGAINNFYKDSAKPAKELCYPAKVSLTKAKTLGVYPDFKRSIDFTY